MVVAVAVAVSADKAIGTNRSNRHTRRPFFSPPTSASSPQSWHLPLNPRIFYSSPQAVITALLYGTTHLIAQLTQGVFCLHFRRCGESHVAGCCLLRFQSLEPLSDHPIDPIHHPRHLDVQEILCIWLRFVSPLTIPTLSWSSATS